MLARTESRTAPRRRLLSQTGITCIAIGLIFIGWAGYEFGYGYFDEQQLNDAFRKELAAGAGIPGQQASGIAARVAFALRVPKLGYWEAVQEGVNPGVLLSGPGHYPGTPWPGSRGNVGVAAHNTYWIRFGDLIAGDEIALETRHGNFKYRMTGRRIVNPNDRSVLAATAEPRLTLTTCWPLYAGAFAGQRLAIFAEVSPAPVKHDGG